MQIRTKVDMEAEFKNLWLRLTGRSDYRHLYDDLVRRYSEPHRAYHTLEHIEHGLWEFNTAVMIPSVHKLYPSREFIELAFWYHDAVYSTDPLIKDNEEKSAELLYSVMREHTSYSDVIATFTAELILATKHRTPPLFGYAKFLVDIDLAILGQETCDFDRYEEQIREEYKDVPTIIFRERRKNILKSLLERGPIYQTQYFMERYEAKARQNLARSIRKLS